MQKTRKTSHITNIIQFDADGHVVIPASLTLGIAPGADDNSAKVPSTAWVRSIITTAGGAYVPTGRTITINGVSYDLSANRSWSVGTVTSVGLTSATSGVTISNSPITGSGNISLAIATASSTQNGLLSSTDWSTFNSKQNAITLTTTGSSGAATLVGATLNIPTYTLSGLGGVPTSRQLTINGTAYDLSADRSWSVGTVTSVGLSVPTGFSVSNTPVTGSGTIAVSFAAGYSLPTTASQTNWDTAYSLRITSLTTTGTSGAATLVSNVLNIPQYQAQGNYITSLTGEATASGPGAAAVTLSNSAVINKILTGLNVTGGSIAATDSILQAFGKIQNQLNNLAGGVMYQGTWNASTNTPTLTSSTGTKGYYYIVNVAGTTNLNGITDWQVGDWAIYDGTSWQKVDNTESVSSVNGFTGAVNLTTANITENTNLYFTNARARQAVSLTTTGSSGAATYNNSTGVFNIPQYTLAGLGGEPAIAAGTTAQYWRGDKSWQTLNTTAVPEGTNLYYTDARARAAISLTTTGTSGAATYSAGVLNIPQYSLSGLGGVPTSRQLTINGTAYDLSADRTWTITNISGTAGSETLATVTARGSSTTGNIFVNGLITGGLGAVTTSGTLDWNDVSNARSGSGYSLLLGTATNGMGGGQYYHPISFEYSSKNGGGNMTQLAIPYTGNGIWYRNRYSGSWSTWARVWDDSSFTSTNITNWNTAYGWGNHASAGYLTTSSAASTYVSLSGSYANPAWITSLAWSKITGAPAFLTSYTETDTLATVTGRGASTSTALTFNGAISIPSSTLSFGSATRQMINLWSTNYGIGVQSSTTYFRSDSRFSWFRGGSHSDSQNDPGGGTVAMTLDNGSNLAVTGSITSGGTAVVLNNGGTWSISITGNANYASSAGNADTVDGLHASAFTRDYGQQVNVGNLNNLDGRFLVNLDGYGAINTAGGPDGSFNAGLIGIGNATRGHQIYLPYDSNQMWFRRGANAWQSWIRLYNSSADPYSTGVNASHIVQRDGNGYIYANHINFNTSETENSTINSFITSNGDGWSRKASLQHAKNSIRGVADGTWGINITGNAATTSQTNFGSLTVNSNTVLHAGNWSSYAAPRAYVTDSFVEFTIYGDQNTYYPVTIYNYNGTYSFQRYTIHRGYSDTAPWNPIGTGVHQGGLTFSFEWAGDIAWGGNDRAIRIVEFYETYTSMVGGMQLAHCEGVVVWLRGGGSGGAYYRLHGPGGRSQGYNINMSSWTSCAGVTYSPRSYDSGTVNSEINTRYPIRGNGTEVYASVFYDSNDTNYYVNPASGSRMSSITYDNLYFASDSTYGLFGRNAYLDTINGRGSDPLELNYYDGGPVIIGTGANGSKALYAGSVYDAGSRVAISRGEGRNYVDYSRYVYNNGAYSGSGWVEPSDLGVRYAASANYATSAGSAGSAGNADTVDGYHAAAFPYRSSGSSGYYQVADWLQFNTSAGLYWPGYYGAHFYPNDYNSHGQFRINGSKNGYGGIVDSYSGVTGIMYDSGGNGGVYREANGRWYWYHHLGNNCTGISTSTTSSSYRAYIGGSLYAEGDVVAYSDARKKTDIVTIDNALEKVTNLRGVYYTRIDDPDRGRQTGVIAQEINEVLPEVVTYAADVDEYGVSYGNIVGVLIEAIKEQQAQIEYLKNQITELKENK